MEFDEWWHPASVWLAEWNLSCELVTFFKILNASKSLMRALEKESSSSSHGCPYGLCSGNRLGAIWPFGSKSCSDGSPTHRTFWQVRGNRVTTRTLNTSARCSGGPTLPRRDESAQNAILKVLFQWWGPGMGGIVPQKWAHYLRWLLKIANILAAAPQPSRALTVSVANYQFGPVVWKINVYFLGQKEEDKNRLITLLTIPLVVLPALASPSKRR